MSYASLLASLYKLTSPSSSVPGSTPPPLPSPTTTCATTIIMSSFTSPSAESAMPLLNAPPPSTILK
eukprot:754007-Hanusia_phi.AAC.1